MERVVPPTRAERGLKPLFNVSFDNWISRSAHPGGTRIETAHVVAGCVALSRRSAHPGGTRIETIM